MLPANYVKRLAVFLDEHWAIAGVLALAALLGLAFQLVQGAASSFRVIAHEYLEEDLLNGVHIGYSSAYHAEVLGAEIVSRTVKDPSGMEAIQRLYRGEDHRPIIGQGDEYYVITYAPPETGSVSELYIVACSGFEPTFRYRGRDLTLNSTTFAEVSESPSFSRYNQPAGNLGQYFEVGIGAGNADNYTVFPVGYLPLCKSERRSYIDEWPNESSGNQITQGVPGISCVDHDSCLTGDVKNYRHWRTETTINAWGQCQFECVYFDSSIQTIAESLLGPMRDSQ
ncbi:MAG: hypothetical protein WA991_08550 [Ornithinimicrobium sp.]